LEKAMRELDVVCEMSGDRERSREALTESTRPFDKMVTAVYSKRAQTALAA
jgi:hypothetical protein